MSMQFVESKWRQHSNKGKSDSHTYSQCRKRKECVSQRQLIPKPPDIIYIWNSKIYFREVLQRKRQQ